MDTQATKRPEVVGALTPEERACVDECKRLMDEFFVAPSEGERKKLMGRVEELVARYDRLCAERERKERVVLRRAHPEGAEAGRG